jgi:hypothetical protein
MKAMSAPAKKTFQLRDLGRKFTTVVSSFLILFIRIFSRVCLVNGSLGGFRPGPRRVQEHSVPEKTSDPPLLHSFGNFQPGRHCIGEMHARPFSSRELSAGGTSYALSKLRSASGVARIMNLGLVGTEPLVGITIQHSYASASPLPDPWCEICDDCGKSILPRNIYFDGKTFLCEGCRQKQRVADKAAR